MCGVHITLARVHSILGGDLHQPLKVCHPCRDATNVELRSDIAGSLRQTSFGGNASSAKLV